MKPGLVLDITVRNTGSRPAMAGVRIPEAGWKTSAIRLGPMESITVRWRAPKAGVYTIEAGYYLYTY